MKHLSYLIFRVQICFLTLYFYLWTFSVDPVREYLKIATKRVCRLTTCNRTCTRRSYEHASCVNDRCKCYNNTKTSSPVSEFSEDQTEGSCDMQACDQLCRRLKFPGGACVNGRCKCDNFLGIEGYNHYSISHNNIVPTTSHDLTIYYVNFSSIRPSLCPPFSYVRFHFYLVNLF